ncbi:uncharacterized protein LOC126890519 [Diabrotica virgifera virgifera]|uniref:Uncharacterized protein n=1 Tax=Diabrotica virgifera virgifera TaxID=50390 RepID=A0ABM5KZ60_DIAVI|nr:uncharacterized protein LOC126890519 [Diabrotica virgifera virgifera]XP_050515475.1 uncharacterized protein LOC126890519 [Diabrotica virgifera virgifera]
MLAVMEASQSTAGPSNTNQVPAVTPEEQAANAKDFLSSGRTGRRNALADILNPEQIIELRSISPSSVKSNETSNKSENDEEDKEENSLEVKEKKIHSKEKKVSTKLKDSKKNNEMIFETDATDLPDSIILINDEILQKTK